ncbi:MAG: hypothetical protein WCJ75_17100 [Desulfomonile sp.]
MRIRIGAHVLLLMLAVTGSSVRAESPQWIIPINSSFRVGYLYGSQVVSTSSDYGSQVVSSSSDPYYNYDVLLDISFGSPVLSCTIELSPISPLTVRIIGDVSVYGQQNTIYGPWWAPTSWTPDGLYSEARPGFAGVEAAGLFDIWRSAGHRFGVIGGWRREYWWYNNQGTGAENPDVWSRDKITTNIPFLGLQAAMAYPGWQSTFEFLTSRFISKTINGSVRQLQDFAEYHCSARNGVLLEARIQGMANMTNSLLVGLFGRFTYQNVSGVFDAFTNSSVKHSLDVHVVENTLTLELQLTLFF